MKKFVALFAAVMMITVGSSLVAATTPEFNQNQDADATVWNTPPYIIGGYIEILNQDGVLVWSQLDPTNSTRADSYIWESEKLVVYAWIHDDNGESDLWQHTAEAWLSPDDAFITDLAIVNFTNMNKTEALFKGEKLMPGPEIWYCTHDVYITDVDKYGYTATNDGLEIFYPLYINPAMSSTFKSEQPPYLDTIVWSQVFAGDKQKEADNNPYIEHVLAECAGIPVTINYILGIHGTDLEGGVGTSHVIPVGNVHYRMRGGSKENLTNGEVELGQFITCEDILFEFYVDVPWIEPGDYYGQVGFVIKAL